MRKMYDSMNDYIRFLYDFMILFQRSSVVFQFYDDNDEKKTMMKRIPMRIVKFMTS